MGLMGRTGGRTSEGRMGGGVLNKVMGGQGGGWGKGEREKKEGGEGEELEVLQFYMG